MVPTAISILQIGKNLVRKRLEFGKNLMIPVLTVTIQGVGSPMNSYYAKTTKADLLLIYGEDRPSMSPPCFLIGY
jgi:hypothetical protein